jgi:cell wall-active antibiotic response 4TMS protein YvqF
MPSADTPSPPIEHALAPAPLTAARRAELAHAREHAIAALSEAFVQDALDVDELERRVTLAHTSEAAEAITGLLADLPVHTEGVAVVHRPPPAPEIAAQTIHAILGGVDRRGAFTMPRRLKIVAMMGGASLDLREARFPAGVMEVDVKAVFGGVQILVPPELAVEVQGTAIMGGFQNVNRAPAHPDPDAPLLRVRGLALMGGVDISMRLPRGSGGSEDRADRRRKREARAAGRGRPPGQPADESSALSATDSVPRGRPRRSG